MGCKVKEVITDILVKVRLSNDVNHKICESELAVGILSFVDPNNVVGDILYQVLSAQRLVGEYGLLD